jgi:hypothetical protein
MFSPKNAFEEFDTNKSTVNVFSEIKCIDSEENMVKVINHRQMQVKDMSKAIRNADKLLNSKNTTNFNKKSNFSPDSGFNKRGSIFSIRRNQNSPNMGTQVASVISSENLIVDTLSSRKNKHFRHSIDTATFDKNYKFHDVPSHQVFFTETKKPFLITNNDDQSKRSNKPKLKLNSQKEMFISDENYRENNKVGEEKKTNYEKFKKFVSGVRRNSKISSYSHIFSHENLHTNLDSLITEDSKQLQNDFDIKSNLILPEILEHDDKKQSFRTRNKNKSYRDLNSFQQTHLITQNLKRLHQHQQSMLSKYVEKRLPNLYLNCRQISQNNILLNKGIDGIHQDDEKIHSIIQYERNSKSIAHFIREALKTREKNDNDKKIDKSKMMREGDLILKSNNVNTINQLIAKRRNLSEQMYTSPLKMNEKKHKKVDSLLEALVTYDEKLKLQLNKYTNQLSL